MLIYKAKLPKMSSDLCAISLILNPYDLCEEQTV